MNIDEQLTQSMSSAPALIFLIFTWIGIAIYKILSFAMPKTAKILFEYFKSSINSDVKEEITALRKEITVYKGIKHSLDGENEILKEAIKLEDPEISKIILEILEKK